MMLVLGSRTCCSGVHDVHRDELHNARPDACDGQAQENAALYEHCRQGLLVGEALGVQESHDIVPVHVCRC
eukprot:1153818-Pelagomonas_calceolata.AAC.5